MSPRTALLLLLPALWLSACGQPQAPATAPAPAEPEIPPAQERPANIGLGIKWAPDSPRYQQVRREAWREGSDFTAKVDFSEQQPSRNGSYVVRVLDKSQPAGEALQALDEARAAGARATGLCPRPVLKCVPIHTLPRWVAPSRNP